MVVLVAVAVAVPVVPVRCWRCGRIVAEVAAGSCVRIKCHCNAWTVHTQQAA
jgi:phage FluMu protein Com